MTIFPYHHITILPDLFQNYYVAILPVILWMVAKSCNSWELSGTFETLEVKYGITGCLPSTTRNWRFRFRNHPQYLHSLHPLANIQPATEHAMCVVEFSHQECGSETIVNC